MKFNIFAAGVLLGFIISFILTQIDNKNMIEKGYIHNIFLGDIVVK